MSVISKTQPPPPHYKIEGCVSPDATIFVLYMHPGSPEYVIVIDKAGEQKCLSCLSWTSFRDVLWEDIKHLMVLQPHKKPLSLAYFLYAVTQTCKLICPAPTPSFFPSPPLSFRAIVEQIVAHVGTIVKDCNAKSLVLSFLHYNTNRDITHENFIEKLMDFIRNSKRPKSDSVLELYINKLCAQLITYAKTPTDDALHVLVQMLELSDLICAIWQKWRLDYDKVKMKKNGNYVLKIEISLNLLQTQEAFNLLMETNHVEDYPSFRNALGIPTIVSVQFKVKN